MESKWMHSLSKALIFKGLSEDKMVEILKCLKPKVQKYKRNEVINNGGIPEKGIGIILSGVLAVSKENATGNRIIMMTLGPGGMFGETEEFSENSIWNNIIYARDDCEVLFLSKEKIMRGCDSICKTHQTLIANMLRVALEKAAMLEKKVEYMALKSTREKICHYLLEQCKNAGNPHLILPLKRNELADFLNITRPSLSRELCHMRDEGIIEFKRSNVHINDLEYLKRLII